MEKLRVFSDYSQVMTYYGNSVFYKATSTSHATALSLNRCLYVVGTVRLIIFVDLFTF